MMLRLVALRAGICLTLVGVCSPSFGQRKFEFAIPKPSITDPSEMRWIVCSTWDQDTNDVYISSIVQATQGEMDALPRSSFETFVKKHYPVSNRLWSYCNIEKTRSAIDWRRNDYMSPDPNHPKTKIEVAWTLEDAKVDWAAPKKPAKDAGKTKAMREAAQESDTPMEPKKSAAQIAAEAAAARKAKYEAEFQAKQDEYERQVADRERRIKEFNELTAKMEAQKKTNVAAAQAAIDAYKQEQEKYAETIRQHQDEVARYQAQVSASSSKPVGVPNAVYRGFTGADCDAARRSATLGAGTSSTTRFKEVTSLPSGTGCLVQGWWWNVAGGGTATRQ